MTYCAHVAGPIWLNFNANLRIKVSNVLIKFTAAWTYGHPFSWQGLPIFNILPFSGRGYKYIVKVCSDYEISERFINCFTGFQLSTNYRS